MAQTQEIWTKIKHTLKEKNQGNNLISAWFDPTSLLSVEESSENQIYKVGVPSELHKYWITHNLLDGIQTELANYCKNPLSVEFIITGESNKKEESAKEAQQDFFTTNYNNQNRNITTQKIINKTHTRPKKDSLNPSYQFSSFVVGRNNEFAHAASYSIAVNPGTENYNPLFICGPTGMGKTHLLHAVGNTLIETHPHLKILYVTAESFLNECVSGIRRSEMNKFREKYRTNCDILLMDDVQILGKGQAVQEEFFNTFNNLIQNTQQVVLASDRMPKDIPGLEDRIRTRFEWGLIADIQMPDLETRIAILNYKIEQRQLKLSNDVVTYIARISKRSIRELEGNLNKVRMFSELQGLHINLDLVKKVLANHDDTTHITSAEIQKLVAVHFKITINDLKSKCRAKPIVTARQVAMHLIKKHLDKSLVDIGRDFGGRDHTTVINALKKIASQQPINLELKRDIEELEERIHNITGL